MSSSDKSMRVIGAILWTLGMLVGGTLLFVVLILPPLLGRNGGDAFLNMLLAGCIAFPACFFYLWVPVILDRYDPEPWWLLAMAFLWGAVPACGFSGLINTINGEIGNAIAGKAGGEIVGAVISAPLVEEAFKGMLVLGMLWFMRREFDGVVDGVIYATFVALGFAATENVLYYARSLEKGGETGLMVTVGLRGILAPWGHPLYTAMTGIGVGLARETTKGWVKVVAPFLGYCGAVLLHATWNGSAVLSDMLQFPLFFLALPLWFLFLLTFGIIVILLVRREGQIIRKHLRDEVLLGNLSEPELELVCSPIGRLRALFLKGLAGRRFVDAASRLGLSKWHAARAMQGKKMTISADFIVPLRRELAQLRAQFQQR
jgi:RsiW-degrading membrane proteinase PrsW (M82 family)